ncbi:curli production assembly/transport component CsgF precursor [Rhodohalobacter sp. SW132]|uniref:curli production assembly/transport component CsgF n=1 Tax=Rhodohalobacter sp. SW132 TaxID=2293433 RepID=UPI000E220A4B|nr:curli production assembly/transport component CsgF [Rhodohalobacter sp. SW132]REL38402.1 curli production assembly/transport component CsgF precursor [Rhodohalobacter sp. SW132]
MKKTLLISVVSVLFLLFGGIEKATAQQFVYQPLNPAFGGNPGNYGWLLNSANTQNLFEATRQAGFQRDPLQDFQDSLQRQVLSQLTRDIVRREFGDGEELQEQVFEFGEFSIEVIPGADGVQIQIFNILTGDETRVTVPNF